MKPGGHPDFFRSPAPEGRSRESSIVLTQAGRFFHEGAEILHPAMRQAFASWLRRHPDDGRYILSNGYDWTYLTVEGAAYFVRAVHSRAGPAELELLDGRVLPLAAAALICDAEGHLWLRLPEGDRASFTAAAQLQLAPWLTERAGQLGLEIDGHFSPVEGAGSA